MAKNSPHDDLFTIRAAERRCRLSRNDQIQQQRSGDEWNQANHEHHVIAWSELTGHEIIRDDGLLDFSQMPQDVNLSADHRDESDCGHDPYR